MEIERKFTVKKLPTNLESYAVIRIEQGYVSRKPVIRIRKSNDKYILTLKFNKNSESGESAICNEEIERSISKDAYEHLKAKVDNYMVQKDRYLIPMDNGLTIELDIFKDRLEGLVFAEVEFESEGQAAAFVKPDWFDEDVSFDKRYRNGYLSELSSLDEM